jgi:hypothetical protein
LVVSANTIGSFYLFYWSKAPIVLVVLTTIIGVSYLYYWLKAPIVLVLTPFFIGASNQQQWCLLTVFEKLGRRQLGEYGRMQSLGSCFMKIDFLVLF